MRDSRDRKGEYQRRKWMPYAVALLAVVSAVLTSLFLFTMVSPTSLKYGGTGESAGPDELKFVYRTLYLGCGHLVEEVHSFPSDAGREISERLRSGETGWRLESQKDGTFVFVTEDPGMCPDDGRFRHFRVQEDGRLAVYYGKPGQGGLLKEVTSINVTHLLDEDMRRIEDGIVLEGDEAVERYLEGLRD